MSQNLNRFDTNIVKFQDVSTLQDHEMYCSGGIFYIDGVAFAPIESGNLNANEIMMITYNLASGVTTQRVYYPLGYEPAYQPKVLFSIIGDNDDPNILGAQLGAVTQDYFDLQFTRAIPNEQFYVQAFILKNDNYLTFSGTNVELNPIRTARTLFVDSVYGNDGGTFSGIRQNPNFPYRSIAAAYGNAQSGDTIEVYPGNYSGVPINNQTVNFRFWENAIVEDVGFVINGVSNVTFNGLNVQMKSGVTVPALSVTTNSVVNLINTNQIKTNNAINIAASGGVNNFGKLFHNGAISAANYVNVDLAPTGINTSPAISLGQNYNGIIYYPDIAAAVAAAPIGSKITVNSGVYNGFTLNAPYTFDFAQGAKVDGRVNINSNISIFRNLQIEPSNPAMTSGALYIAGTGVFYGDNSVKPLNNVAITGNGVARTIGNLSYYGLVDPSLQFSQAKKATVVSSLPFVSGKNGDSYFANIVDAVAFTSNVDVNSDLNSFTLGQSASLKFAAGTKVLGSISLSNGVYQLDKLYLDVPTGTSVGVSLSNASGYFRGDSLINVPSAYSGFYVTGTGLETGAYYVPWSDVNVTVTGFTSGDYSEFITDGVNFTGIVGSGTTVVGGTASISGNGVVIPLNLTYNTPFVGVTNLMGNGGYQPSYPIFTSYKA